MDHEEFLCTWERINKNRAIDRVGQRDVVSATYTIYFLYSLSDFGILKGDNIMTILKEHGKQNLFVSSLRK